MLPQINLRNILELLLLRKCLWHLHPKIECQPLARSQSLSVTLSKMLSLNHRGFNFEFCKTL